MALASQMPRGRGGHGGFGPSRSSRGRGKRGGSGWVWFMLAALACGSGYWWYSFSGKQAATTQPSANQETPAVPATVDPAANASSPSTGAPTAATGGSIPVTDANAVVFDRAASHAEKLVTTTMPATGPSTSIGASAQLAAGMKLIENGNLVQGRKALSRLLAAGVWDEPHTTTAPGAAVTETDVLSEEDAQTVRDTLTSINRTLIFSTKYIKDDPLVDFHTVEPDDKLLKITPAYRVPYQAIEYINNTPASRIRVGQRLKLIRGPFHAVVSKREFRMDVYLKDPGDGSMLYIRSFRVGLGESDSTPAGSWIIKKGGKIANPQWSNPKTGEYFPSGDPKNPIGKFWLALDGTDDYTKTKKGFGIHGTVDPDSIGKQASMGCVRLADADIELVYKLLSDGLSTVLILP